jgi:hypothetical protein
MWRPRLKSVVAATVIGDGVIAAVTPKRHMARWEKGPRWWQRLARPLRERPGVTRVVGVVQTLLGVVWARRLRPRRA